RLPGRRRGSPDPERDSSVVATGYPVIDGSPALAQDPARRAALPSWRRRDPGDHVEHRPRPGDQAPDPRLLGVPRHDHRVGEAPPERRWLPRDSRLEWADPEI